MISAFRFLFRVIRKKKEKKNGKKPMIYLFLPSFQQQHYSSLNSVSPTVESVSSCP